MDKQDITSKNKALKDLINESRKYFEESTFEIYRPPDERSLTEFILKLLWRDGRVDTGSLEARIDSNSKEIISILNQMWKDRIVSKNFLKKESEYNAGKELFEYTLLDPYSNFYVS